MKKRLSLAAITICAFFISQNSMSQKPASKVKKSQEIIIHKDDNKTSKMTIEIDGDSVLINGKPLSEYNGDDVSVIKRNLMNRGSHNSLLSPDNKDFEIFSRDYNNAKPKAFLGVMMNATAAGVQLTDVVKGSAAEKAGLKKGDIITKVNGEKITKGDELTEIIQAYKPGDEINISYTRENKNKDLKVKLGAAKNDADAFMYNSDNNILKENGFNYQMPPMPKMQPLNNLYNFRLNDDNRPKLGMKIEDTKSNDGVKIINVEDGSAAEKAGLKKDDIITSVNSEKVNSVDEVKEQIDELNDTKSVNIIVMRNSVEMNIEITIPKKLNSADL